MKAPPTAIIVLSPEVVEQEQNSSANQVKEEEDTIIVEQEQNSLKETHTSVFVAICNKAKRGEDYGILQLVISIDIHISFLAPVVRLGSPSTTLAYMSRIGESLQYDTNIHLYLPD